MTYQQLTQDFIQNRDNKSFAPLYNKLYKSLSAYIGKQTRNPELTDDIVANTLVKVWDKIDQYDPAKASITSWSYRIAQNEMYAHFNKSKNTVNMSRLEGGEVDDSGDFNLSTQYSSESFEDMKTEQDHWDEYNDNMSTLDTALNTINELDEQFKNILTDRLVHEMKYQEIADKYGIHLSKVKCTIHHGKKKIQKIMGK